MFTILEDTCGRHDIMLTPCSKNTFSIIYGETEPRPGCEGNLVVALAACSAGQSNNFRFKPIDYVIER
jgi:uncharacterized protein